MGDKRNYAALDWVIGEIGETLKDARQSLEAYVEDPRDTARIRFCLTHIHQVHGSLQMVEFHGACLFAEEMELLAEAIMNGQVTNDKEAHEALMRSLLQLPLYLEQVRTHHEDHPSVVLPLLNDLRAVRKQSYLSETNLFNPDLSSLDQIRGERHPVLQDRAKLKQVLQKLREMYQFAAASVLRGIKIDENLAYIEKVFSRLESITRGTRCYPIWQVGAALLEALIRDDVELSIAVRGLLRHLSRELKILEDHCPAAMDAPARESLLRNLLYYVARADAGGVRTAQVKQQYGLDKAVVGGVSRMNMGRGMVSPPEPDAIKAVVLALQDELNTCKHLLDLALTGQGGMSDLDELRPCVKRIGDTLAVLGVGDLRKQAMAQYDALELICQAGTYDDGALIDIAGGLANIENRLEAIVKGVSRHRDYANVDEHEIEIDSAKEAVLNECRIGLDLVKNAIVESMSSQWDPSHLPAAIETLHYVHGGLNMVPLPRPAAVLEACGEFISQQLLQRKSAPTQELQILAEAIASIDYFLERLQGGHGDDLDIYLDMAEVSLEQLHDRSGVAASLLADSQHDSVDNHNPHVGQNPQNINKPHDSYSHHGAEEPDIETSGSKGATANRFDPAKFEFLSDPEAPPLEPTMDLASDAYSLADGGSSAVAEVEPPPLAADGVTPEENEIPQVTSTAVEVEEETDIDAEIIEIFVEESQEVLGTLAEFLPKWRDDLNDEQSLTVIRRAFHTLKGSGRMVEAYDVGELAWAIENMLNRVIDRTTVRQSAHIVLIDQVLGLIPKLVEAFAERQPNPDPSAHARYIDWAQRMATGDVPQELLGHGGYVDIHSADGDVEAGLDAEAEPEVPEVDLSTNPAAIEDESEDQALWDIFASEASTHLQVLDEFIAEMDRAAPLYSAPNDDVQRALHTLKGSAHMAAVTPIATMITPLETFVKELRSYQLRIDDDILQLLKDASTYTRQGLSCIDRREPVTLPKLEQFVARVNELSSRAIGPLIHLREQGVMTGPRVDPSLLAEFMSQDMRLLLEADRWVRQWQSEGHIPRQDMQELLTELRQLEDVAGRANLPELQVLAVRLSRIYEALNEGVIDHSDELFDAIAVGHERLLDMLDQVAASMTVQPVSAELLDALERLVPNVAPAPLQDRPFEDTLLEIANPEFLEAIPVDGDMDTNSWGVSEISVGDVAETMTFETGSMELTEPDVDASNDADFAIEIEEAESALSTDDYSVEEESAATLPTIELADDGDEEIELGATEFEASDFVVEPLPSVAANNLPTAEVVAEDDDFGFSGHDFGSDDDDHLLPYEESDELTLPMAVEEPLSTTESEAEMLVDSDQDRVIETTEAVAESDDMFGDDVPMLLDQVWQESEDAFELAAEPEEETVLEHERELEATSSWNDHDGREHDDHEQDRYAVQDREHFVADYPVLAATDEAAPNDVSFIETDEFDPDILEIFLEEAGELIEELDESIHAWEGNWNDVVAPETMKRALHTFKGGARLSGLKNLGELTHNYESYLIGVGHPSADEQFFHIIHAYQDNLLIGVRGVRARLNGESVPIASVPVPAPQFSGVEAIETVDYETHSPATGLVPLSPADDLPEVDEDTGFAEPRQQPRSSAVTSNKRQGSQEMIKVSADLLEELVNLAGETSISRGRLEQQVSDLSSAVGEVDATLRRLNEQLRRLDIETDAQVMFRQEHMAAHEGFDPLEMDRYSQLQQLTRSLMESASDLSDLKTTLSDKIRDTETLLLQQSRINTALQHGLMRSRMVPFSRLVPRLRRIVRQVSGELGKHVNFELDNVEGEMDRSVLERMVAPLEHMLRNAVDHGIEMPDERLQNRKPETGRILLSLSREGGDILLRMADDGRGIHLQKVRAKAIERGLMTADAELNDHDIMQFILQPGFSTAENVTQISGRGVGMDVVAAEIKQLGGSIVIDSKMGAGTQFTVRLPFTVSVNRALMVVLGTETYAIPLNTIEGIVRVSPFELEHYYSHPDARFEYAGENYQVRHLGTMLDADYRPKLEGQVLPLPVILVRSGQHTMALQVDSLLGSREIVVKSLGPQFAMVQGLSGATVMGDGSVVIILDPHALVRRDVAHSALPAVAKALPAPVELVPALKTIMVVDDSVTVRKVTTRFLEREGFNVITANDGVDALQILQEEVPDLMLLDIEMPRMDGFEVAKNIRSTRRLKHLPIIMITSRTGDKHRQHALSIGVNDYMGKPYQEEALLKTMLALLSKPSVSA